MTALLNSRFGTLHGRVRGTYVTVAGCCSYTVARIVQRLVG